MFRFKSIFSLFNFLIINNKSLQNRILTTYNLRMKYFYQNIFLLILLDEFKESLKNEIKQWQILFANGVLESSKLKYLCKYVSENYGLLALPINELQDARRVILCMEEIEVNLMTLDEDIENTCGIYDLLSEYKVPILPEDERQLNMLIENYEKLKTKVKLNINQYRNDTILISNTYFYRSVKCHKDCTNITYL